MIWTCAVSLGQRLLRKSIEVDRKRSMVFDIKSPKASKSCACASSRREGMA